MSPILTWSSTAICHLFCSQCSMLPPRGLLPWRSPSLGYAKKRRMRRLSRRFSGHGGCSVPMNRWTNAGDSIDGHLPSAWRVPYKRVCECLRVMSVLNERQRCKTVICVLWMREKNLWTSSLLNAAQNELVYGIS